MKLIAVRRDKRSRQDTSLSRLIHVGRCAVSFALAKRVNEGRQFGEVIDYRFVDAATWS